MRMTKLKAVPSLLSAHPASCKAGKTVLVFLTAASPNGSHARTLLDAKGQAAHKSLYQELTNKTSLTPQLLLLKELPCCRNVFLKLKSFVYG